MFSLNHYFFNLLCSHNNAFWWLVKAWLLKNSNKNLYCTKKGFLCIQLSPIWQSHTFIFCIYSDPIWMYLTRQHSFKLSFLLLNDGKIKLERLLFEGLKLVIKVFERNETMWKVLLFRSREEERKRERERENERDRRERRRYVFFIKRVSVFVTLL